MSDRLLKESDVKRIAFQLPYVLNSAFFDAVKALPSADNWIFCSERLPDKHGRYLVGEPLFNDELFISILQYGRPDFPEKKRPCFYYPDDEWGDVEYDDVIAWMPLPELPPT